MQQNLVERIGDETDISGLLFDVDEDKEAADNDEELYKKSDEHLEDDEDDEDDEDEVDNIVVGGCFFSLLS